jgi:hypothetical protein
MNRSEQTEFIDAMRQLDPDIMHYEEALFFAMDSVDRIPRSSQIQYFGQIGTGTFYADGNPSRVRWFPETTPVEAIGLLNMEFGERLTAKLRSF